MLCMLVVSVLDRQRNNCSGCCNTAYEHDWSMGIPTICLPRFKLRPEVDGTQTQMVRYMPSMLPTCHQAGLRGRSGHLQTRWSDLDSTTMLPQKSRSLQTCAERYAAELCQGSVSALVCCQE